MSDAPAQLTPRIEYVLEGHYLQPGGVREWQEHSHADTRDEAFNPHLGVDTTETLHQPNEWRIVERHLNQLYAVQGFYPRGRKARQWATHTDRVDLETAQAVYAWFHRLCQDPDYDMANDARVINIGTGQVVPMTGFVVPVKQPGDAIRTIPVTPAEWSATRWSHIGWGTPLQRGKRRDGTFVWKSGRDYIAGYEDADGNVRIRPREYQVPRERPSMARGEAA